MAEVWIAAATVGAAVVGGVASNAASKRAAGASNAATQSSIGEQGRQYDQTRADFAPTRQLGTSATNSLNRLYGYAPAKTEAELAAEAPVRVGDADLPAGVKTVPLGNGRWDVQNPDGSSVGTLVPGGSNGRFQPNGVPIAQAAPVAAAGAAGSTGTPGKPDMGAFFESPDYQFNLQEGQKAIDRSLAARGGTLSGAGVKEGVRYASGLASGQYSDFTNRLLTMAGLGNAATSSTASAGANAANNNSAALLANGQNQASIAMQNGANINNAAQGGISNLLLQRYLTPGGNTGYPGPYGGH